MHEHVSHHLEWGVGVVLTTGTNLSNGQHRSQITGSDLHPPPRPQHLRDITQGTPESV